MQLYAQDQKGTRVFVELAEKAKNYFCLECQKEVRARGGPHIQLHFYHAEKNGLCRQNGKTDQHLLLQKLLNAAYPGSEQELHFPAIHRIADVALVDKKIIFEVQCSPMTSEEMRRRVQDYKQVGFQVIWILSDSTFLKKKVSALEMAIQDFPHYYAKGQVVYDACSLIHQGVRQGRPITKIIKIGELDKRKTESSQKKLPQALLRRHAQWEYHFAHDLLEQDESVFAALVAKEQALAPIRTRFSVGRYIRGLYHSLLSQSCR